VPAVTVATVWPLVLLAALPLVWWLAWRNHAGVGRSRVAGATALQQRLRTRTVELLFAGFMLAVAIWLFVK